MADTKVKVGNIVDFAGGTGNTLTFDLDIRIPGWQATATGFVLSDATVSYRPWGAAEDAYEVIDVSELEDRISASFSDSTNVIRAHSVRFGGLPTGTYKIGVTQAS